MEIIKMEKIKKIKTSFSDSIQKNKHTEKEKVSTEEIDYFLPLPTFSQVAKYRKTVPPLTEFIEI